LFSLGIEFCVITLKKYYKDTKFYSLMSEALREINYYDKKW